MSETLSCHGNEVFQTPEDPVETVAETGEVDELILDDLEKGDSIIVDTADHPDDWIKRYEITIASKPKVSSRPFGIVFSSYSLMTGKGRVENHTAQFSGGMHRRPVGSKGWGGITQHFIRRGDCLYFHLPKDSNGNRVGRAERSMPIIRIVKK